MEPTATETARARRYGPGLPTPDGDVLLGDTPARTGSPEAGAALGAGHRVRRSVRIPRRPHRVFRHSVTRRTQLRIRALLRDGSEAISRAASSYPGRPSIPQV